VHTNSLRPIRVRFEDAQSTPKRRTLASILLRRGYCPGNCNRCSFELEPRLLGLEVKSCEKCIFYAASCIEELVVPRLSSLPWNGPSVLLGNARGASKQCIFRLGLLKLSLFRILGSAASIVADSFSCPAVRARLLPAHCTLARPLRRSRRALRLAALGLANVTHVSGERVVCDGRLFARATNCRSIPPRQWRIKVWLVRRTGFCFGYLLRRNGPSRCPFPSLGLAGGRRTSQQGSRPRTSDALARSCCGPRAFARSLGCGTCSGRRVFGPDRPKIEASFARHVRPPRPRRAFGRQGRPSRAAPASERNATWLILPVVICLSQRLSHACVSMN
jgi:hypothetical protein